MSCITMAIVIVINVLITWPCDNSVAGYIWMLIIIMLWCIYKTCRDFIHIVVVSDGLVVWQFSIAVLFWHDAYKLLKCVTE